MASIEEFKNYIETVLDIPSGEWDTRRFFLRYEVTNNQDAIIKQILAGFGPNHPLVNELVAEGFPTNKIYPLWDRITYSGHLSVFDNKLTKMQLELSVSEFLLVFRIWLFVSEYEQSVWFPPEDHVIEGQMKAFREKYLKHIFSFVSPVPSPGFTSI